MKLISEGTPIKSVVEIMKCNSRLPDFLEGDMWAGIAAARVGERRILGLVGKYGLETFNTALQVFMDYGEQVALRALAGLPKGRFSLEEEQDSGAVYGVTVEITDDEFIVDLRDNPDQDPGPNNASRDGTMIAAQMVFMNITDAHSSANAGHFRPLKVLTRPGSVFDASPPAAFATYYEVEIRLYDVIWRCLAPHLGDRLPAGSFASICGTFIGGPHPDTGRHFTIVEPQVGGWGGSALQRRQQRDVQRLPRRHLQLPGGGRRGPLRPLRRPARSERRAGWRGRAPRRQGDRARLPRALGRLLLHVRVHAQQAQAVAARRAAARARRTTPR